MEFIIYTHKEVKNILISIESKNGKTETTQNKKTIDK